MKAVGCSTLVMLAGILIWTPAAEASWSYDPQVNNPICAETGIQSAVQVVGDGDGGYIAVWMDTRGVGTDIRAQRVDAAGNVSWVADGVTVCSAGGNQSAPRVIGDGAGGAVIVWLDTRNGPETDIYAQRIDADGAALWAADGVAVCAAAGNQYAAVLAPDGGGGAYIAWEDLRSSPMDGDVFAQLVNSSGAALWTSGGVALSDSTGAQCSPAAVCDGSGGAIFVWSDSRPLNGGIHATRKDAAGADVWSTTSSLLDGGAVAWGKPTALADGWGGAFIACEATMGSGELDIIGQRVSASGTVLWGPGGANICDAAGDQRDVLLVSDDAGGAVAAWVDERSGSSTDIYALRVDGWGASQWLVYPTGLPVSSGSDDAGAPAMTADGAGGAVITWHGGQPDYEDIFAQRFNGEGTVLWTPGGEILSSAFGQKLAPQIVSDGAGGGVVFWTDLRSSAGADIFAQRIERNGYLGYPAPELTTVRDHPDDQGGEMLASWSPSYLDIWPHDEVGYYTVWRRYAGTSRSARPSDSFPWYLDPRDPDALERDGWAYVGQVQSNQIPEYAHVVPTYGDSTFMGTILTDVMVLAHSYVPEDSWMSGVMTGYSVDNWAPGPPDSLTATPAWLAVELTWSPSRYRDEDLSHYDIHRSDTQGFTPDETTLIASPTDTFLIDVDPGEGTWYYRAIAEDVHGNESIPSDEAFTTLQTGIGDSEVGAVLAIRGNVPNPFNPKTSIAYDLPVSGRVRLDIFSASGELVATIEDVFREAGSYEVTWTGKDGFGRAMPSGVYFARLEAGEEVAVHKMVLLK